MSFLINLEASLGFLGLGCMVGAPGKSIFMNCKGDMPGGQMSSVVSAVVSSLIGCLRCGENRGTPGDLARSTIPFHCLFDDPGGIKGFFRFGVTACLINSLRFDGVLPLPFMREAGVVPRWKIVVGVGSYKGWSTFPTVISRSRLCIWRPSL